MISYRILQKIFRTGGGLYAGVVMFLAVCSNCLASYISMEVRAGTIVTGENFIVNVSAINKGDEPARFVTASVMFYDKQYWGETVDNLATGEVYYTRVTLPGPVEDGIHTAVIRIYYSDSNCYPFTALSAVPVVTEGPATISELINLSITPVILKHREVCNVTLVPTHELTASLPITLRLVTPYEIECKNPVVKTVVAPNQPRTIQFKIRNISALPGSNYGIMVIADYRWKEQHRSLVAGSAVHIAIPFLYTKNFRNIILGLLIVTSSLFFLLQLLPKSKLSPQITCFLSKSSGLICAGVVIFVLLQLRPDLILLDTTTTGGDTPAHNYLASHLRNHIQEGRIVSWSNGWWCGFPVFQFYFCFPYFLVILLDTFLPFNIAFKIVTVLGILTLPIAGYVSARLFRLPLPAPLFLACATVIFLFDHTHTMWGGNIYSTLAGMIANSIAFSLMQIAIASVWRDYTDARFRFRTVFLLALLPITHFFTTVMVVAVVIIFPLLKPERNRVFQRIRVLLLEGIIAVLLASWWLIPLIVKSEYSMDFGYNWNISLLSHALSRVDLCLLLFLATGVIIATVAMVYPYAFKNRHAVAMALKIYPFCMLNFWMLLCASFFFKFGYEYISPVFVNVRLFPFISWAIITLAGGGYSILISMCKHRVFAIIPVFLMTVLTVLNSSYGVRLWATWNYSGAEKRPLWRVFEELVIPLHNTPGRLANDLHEANNFAFGSTRFFECVPHMVSKPILEGGIVNSAIGSMFSYYIQGETSDACAGFPNIMIPPAFNITNATKHLELFNVKHFIARAERTKKEFNRLNEWKLLRSVQAWNLYELQTHDGSYVFIPEYFPVAVETPQVKDRWKENALWWIYTPEALHLPFLFVKSKKDLQSIPSKTPVISEASYRQLLHSSRHENTQIREWLLLGPFPVPRSCNVPLEYNPIIEENISPVEGVRSGTYRWELCAFETPVVPSDFWRRKKGEERKSNAINYAFVYIYSPCNTNAVITFSTDSPVKIWVNKKALFNSAISTEQTSTLPVKLHKGRNSLMLKIYQKNENSYFDVNISACDNTSLKDIVVTTAPVCPVSVVHEAIPDNKKQIIQESISDTKIRFHTKATGLPHIIKCTWYPNWKVKGARGVYMVSPCFMLVYPEKEEVELYYSTTLSDRAGFLLTMLGIALCILIAIKSIVARTTSE